MLYASTSVLLALAMSKHVLAATIQSPVSLVTCQPIAVSYNDAPEGDVFISVIQGGDAKSPALVDLGKHSGPSGQITWIVNLAAETGVTFKLVDKDGQITFSSPIDIQSGPDSSCIGKPASVSASTVKPSTSSTTASSETGSSSSSSASTSSSSSSSSMATDATSSGTALPSGESSTAESSTTTLPESTTSVPFEGTGFTSSIAAQPGAGFTSYRVSAGLVTAMVGFMAFVTLV